MRLVMDHASAYAVELVPDKVESRTDPAGGG
jgi:hypothetical protein